LNDVDDMAEFAIYPNPAKDVLTVYCSDKISSVEVFNLLGQQVYMAKVGKASTTIDISSLAKGNYVVKLYTDKGVTTKKIVKQ
jgi:hypothetical protein